MNAISKTKRLGLGLAAAFARTRAVLDPRPSPARRALDQWLKELQPSTTVQGRVLITALRNSSWIEWAAYAACVFRQLGYESTLIYSGQQAKKSYHSLNRSQTFFEGIHRIPGMELVDLDEIVPKLEAVEALRPSAVAAGPAALAYDLHLEEHDVIASGSPHASRLPSFIEANLRLGAAMHQVASRRSYHRFLCYSGLIAESAVMLESARRLSIEAVCVEGWAWRPGHLIYNFGAPALEYNVPGWLNALGDWDEQKECEIASYLKFLDGQGRDQAWLNNFYLVQKSSVTAALEPHVRSFVDGDAPIFLLTPNVIGDSSMLNRETIFVGQQEWTREVIQWFRQRPHLKLVVRAHPAEQWVGAKCIVHMGQVARRAAAGSSNILVIDSTEKLNIFSLLPFARAGLAWLSSAGVDMVVRGLPVVNAARPKYSGLGIVEEPTSKEAYFQQLDTWSREPVRPTPDQMRAGRRYLHLVFKGFSFPAYGTNYHATTCTLNGMPDQLAHDRFYRILLGLEPAPDRTPPRLDSDNS